MPPISTIVVRTVLSIFGGVVLGLSITLAKQQRYQSVPTETSFSSFAGAFGIIASAFGLASACTDKIPHVIVLGVDALSSLFYLAGGIALTVAMKGVSSCTSTDNQSTYDRITNKLLTGGCVDLEGGQWCGFGLDVNATIGRCQRVQADYVFEFLGFILGIGVIVLTWMLHRRGGGGGSASYI